MKWGPVPLQPSTPIGVTGGSEIHHRGCPRAPGHAVEKVLKQECYMSSREKPGVVTAQVGRRAALRLSGTLIFSRELLLAKEANRPSVPAWDAEGAESEPMELKVIHTKVTVKVTGPQDTESRVS